VIAERTALRPKGVVIPYRAIATNLDALAQVWEWSEDDVVVHSPNLFSGYLHDLEATAAGFHEGWFMTGDLATRSDDGYFRLVGRGSSDLIKTAGFKVRAGEVEAALLEHEAVVEAAVPGVPDREYGERIVAWVVVRSGSHVTAETLADYAAARLVSHKRPREITLVRRLPRNDMGKVVKRSLFETAPQASFPPRRLQR
jgi:malonyl-CoA/methylmalonyl-CoA synthetase